MLKDISIHGPIWMGFDDLKQLTCADSFAEVSCYLQGGVELIAFCSAISSLFWGL